MLANIGLFSVALASGVCPDKLTATNTNGLMCQQQQNDFLAATQLPGEPINSASYPLNTQFRTLVACALGDHLAPLLSSGE